jgi:hypothetical protein
LACNCWAAPFSATGDLLKTLAPHGDNALLVGGLAGRAPQARKDAG